MPKTWKDLLDAETQKPYYRELERFVESEYQNGQVFPAREDIFKALELTAPEEVKCVILGQDPYHDLGQAHGLAFSVQPGVQIPPSLVNIYKELHDELGTYIPDNGCLVKWAEQGVLLLNSVLTVRAHEAASHGKKGWEKYTDAVIRCINGFDRPVVFMLWGGFARSKTKMLDNPKHLILEAPHPSPLSVYRGFYGCGHFRKCNEFLKQNGIDPIDWQIENIQQSFF